MSFKKNFKICSKNIGESHRCLIVAEISANHNNNFKIVKRLIKSAKKSGADLIKIQTYTADSLILKSKKKDFKIKKKPLSTSKNFGSCIKKQKLHRVN